MKKKLNRMLIFTMILSVFYNSYILGAEVKNLDKPLNGKFDFKLQKLWEINGTEDCILAQIADIQVDNDGRIYILEWKQYKFFVFDQNGKYLYSFGKRGEGPSEYKIAFSFFLKGEYVIVLDQDKAHYFKKNGDYVKSYAFGAMLLPRTFLDEHRFLMIRESEDKKEMPDKLEIFDLTTMKHTVIAEIMPEKELSASGEGMSLRFKDAGTTPMVIAAEYNNELYFGNNDRYLIKKIDYNGKELLSFSISGREKKKIPPQVKRKRFENVRLNNQPMPREMIDQMVKNMPDYCTYYNKIFIDKSGLIYIYVNDAVNETGQEIDIFSVDGKYLYHANIQLPGGLKRVSPFIITGNNLVVFVEDEDGEQKLVKFQIEKQINY